MRNIVRKWCQDNYYERFDSYNIFEFVTKQKSKNTIALTESDLAKFWGQQMESIALEFLSELLSTPVLTFEQSKLTNFYSDYTNNIRYDAEIPSLKKNEKESRSVLVEVKCPYSLDYTKIRLEHYSQMQMYMGCFKRSECLYFVWSPIGFSLYMTQFDDVLWKKHYIPMMLEKKDGCVLDTKNQDFVKSMQTNLKLLYSCVLASANQSSHDRASGITSDFKNFIYIQSLYYTPLLYTSPIFFLNKRSKQINKKYIYNHFS